MSWSLGYLEQAGVVTVTNQGDVTLIALQEQTAAAIKRMQQHQVFLCLVDCRKAQIALHGSEIMQLVHYYDRLGGDRRYRLAVVMPVAENAHAVFQLYETATYNRGYRTRLFDQYETALTWLTEFRLATDPEKI